MKMDDTIKKIINQDFAEVPKGYEDRIDQLLEQLPERSAKTSKCKDKYKISKIVAMVALMVVLSTGTVAAGVMLINLGRGKLDVSKSTNKFQKIVDLKEIKENNGQVNVSSSCNDIIFTVDNIGIDQGNLIVYYTVQTKTKKELPGEDGESTRTRLNQILQYFSVSIDEEELHNMHISNEIYQINEKKVRGVFRQNISKHLKERVKIDVGIRNIWNTDGAWSIHLLVDRKDVIDESIRKNVRQDIVKSMVLSPLGNVLEIKNGYKNRNFVLRDQQGNYLFYAIDSLQENESSYCNFFANPKELEKLQLIPMKEVNKATEFTSLALEQGQTVNISDHTKFKVHQVIKSKDTLRVYLNPLEYDGAIYTNGKEEEFLKGSNINHKGLELDSWIDYENQLVVLEFHDTNQLSDFRTAKEIVFVKQQIQLQKEKLETINCK